MNPDILDNLLKRSLDPMAQRLGMGHLRIKVCHRDLPRDEDSRTNGQAVTKPLYNRMQVFLDHAHLDGADEAVRVLRHELLHWFNRELELHHDLCMSVIPDAAKPAIEEHFTQMCEEQVLNLERMLDAHDATPTALAKRIRT